MAIAKELGVSARTVYGAMERRGLTRRAEPGTLKLRRPQLSDPDWLQSAVERSSSTAVAAELAVSPGTVTSAYERAGIDPASTTRLHERGHSRQRPSPDQLRAAWDAEGTFRGIGQRLGVAHTTAAVWLAEVGVFSDTAPALLRSDLLDAIEEQWPISRIAAEHEVSAATVKVELHRHGLFGVHRNRHRADRDASEDILPATSSELERPSPTAASPPRHDDRGDTETKSGEKRVEHHDRRVLVVQVL